MAHVFVIDNYDSFTYNLVQLLGDARAPRSRSRATTRSTWPRSRPPRPTHLLVSPGPCTPDEAGVSLEAIAQLRRRACRCWACAWATSASAQAFGGRVRRAAAVVHGKTDLVHHDGRTLFAGLPQPFAATRYHSLIVDPELSPDARAQRLERRRRGHGAAPPQPRRRGRAVPPRERAHRSGSGPAWPTSSTCAAAPPASAPARSATAAPRKDRDDAQRHPLRALATLSAGGDLSEDEARGVVLEIMGGGVGEAQTAALLSRAAGEGRDGRGDRGHGARHDRPGREGRRRRRRHPRHLRHGRRRRPHLQHLDGRRPDRRRRRRDRGQARQPLGDQPLRQRRRARGPRRGHRHHAAPR